MRTYCIAQGAVLRVDGRGVWGRVDTCICMTELLYCAPETITTLYFSYTQTQNKRLKKGR